jgi:hypothetical protein
MPPSGRNRKPTPNVANAASVPIVGLTFGKKALLNTSAATMPYNRKSYQSTTAPTKLPSAARRASLRVLSPYARRDESTAECMMCLLNFLSGYVFGAAASVARIAAAMRATVISSVACRIVAAAAREQSGPKCRRAIIARSRAIVERSSG